MDAIDRALEAIQNTHDGIKYKLNEPFRNHTTFGIGGPVRVMFFPKTTTEITELCETLSKIGIAPLITGNGSNILASDEVHELVVINTTDSNKIEKSDETEITVDAGAFLWKVAMFARDNGLAGLEFAHGIPGTLGGAVVMNAGAYGSEMKDVVIETTAYSTKSGIYTLTNNQHEFAYRYSKFSGNDDIVLSSVLRLKKGNSAAINSRMQELVALRISKQPLDLPSSGSTFKRPCGAYAAELIEKSGLKGFTVGGAKVSEKHAGFIVNYNNATFDDVIAVIEHVQETVFREFNTELELEVKIVK